MNARILWLNPVMTSTYDEPIAEALQREARPGTRVDVASLAGAGPRHLEYHAYEMVAAASTMGAIRWAERAGYDAAVIGCFYDPALRGAREITTRMAVTAPAEACLHIANTLGERVSIIVGRDKWIPEMHENVQRYGFADRLASFRVLGMSVDEFQRDPGVTEARIVEEAHRAIGDDGADVIVLGCTIEFGFYRKVQQDLGVPVIDALVAPLRYAEFLADLRDRHGWAHSKRLGYGLPESAELDEWVPIVEPTVVTGPRP
jgi:allantoin racemase